MTQRRDFLKFLGATAAAGALLPKSTLAAAVDELSHGAKLQKIGVQLYSVRGAMEKDGVDATLPALRASGSARWSSLATSVAMRHRSATR